MSEGERHPIMPRRVSFDRHSTPLHWIPDEPMLGVVALTRCLRRSYHPSRGER